jgi:hypothetical protein
MRKTNILLMALLMAGIIGVSFAAADNTVGSQNAVRARISTMGALGNGIAISQSDPMNFEIIKIGIAGVKIGLSENASEVRAGLLHFGEQKYRLKDIAIGNDSASATIYLNGTQVGSITLNSYPKGDKEIWAGTLTLDGVTYNAYVIQAARVVKAVEKAEKVFDYCRNNPVKCKAVMKAVGQIVCDHLTDGNCSGKIRTFCESNPEDNRCKALELAGCKEKLNDSDCRAELMALCQANNTEQFCERLGNAYGKALQIRSQAASGNMPEWFRAVKARITNQLGSQGGQ